MPFSNPSLCKHGYLSSLFYRTNRYSWQREGMRILLNPSMDSILFPFRLSNSRKRNSTSQISFKSKGYPFFSEIKQSLRKSSSSNDQYLMRGQTYFICLAAHSPPSSIRQQVTNRNFFLIDHFVDNRRRSYVSIKVLNKFIGFHVFGKSIINRKMGGCC